MIKTIFLSYIKRLRKKLHSESPLLQIIIGPRQVGKTTTTLKLLEEEFGESFTYLSADAVFNPNADWLREEWLLAAEQQNILVIDEIQKAHQWSDTVKALYDEGIRKKKSIKCILLGSSSLEIQKGLAESLTGRFELTTVSHWNLSESVLGYGLDFDTFLKYGGYPGSYQLIDSDDWFSYVKNSIISTVVEKDILQFHNVKNPSLFRQAFELLISYPAQEISYSKLLGQLQDKGNIDLIKYYIRLFEGAYLVKTLEKFSSKPIKIKASSPKVIPLAPCLSYLHIRSEYSTEERGRVFEALVGSQLIRTGEEVFYWRRGDEEIDFVLRVGKNIYGIEVKSGRKKRAKGLTAFKKEFTEARTCIISMENYQAFEQAPMTFVETHSM